jgi:hypothetical protein
LILRDGSGTIGSRQMQYMGRPRLLSSEDTRDFGDRAFVELVQDEDGPPVGLDHVLLVFRGQSPEEYELVYLRAHRAGQWDAIQYTPVFNGEVAWQLYSGQGYTAPADFQPNRWVHVHLAVSGRVARMFVNHAAEPQLVIADLKRPWVRGSVGLWALAGAANFSNFTFSSSSSSTGAESGPTRSNAGPDLAPGVLQRSCLSPRLTPASPRRSASPGRAWYARRLKFPSPAGAQHRSLSSQVTPIHRDTRQNTRTWCSRRPPSVRRARRVRMQFGYSDAVPSSSTAAHSSRPMPRLAHATPASSESSASTTTPSIST